MPLWCSQVGKKKKKKNKIRLFHCLSMKSPSQSGPCKCVMYVTAGKAGTWWEFLWRGQITARVRRHLCCWTAREAPTAVFTLVLYIHLLLMHDMKNGKNHYNRQLVPFKRSPLMYSD